jgi:hypothetical protein
MSILSEYLRNNLNTVLRDELINILLDPSIEKRIQLVRSLVPLVVATPVVESSVVEIPVVSLPIAAPVTISPNYSLPKSKKTPSQFILHADHLGSAAIKEKFRICTDRKLSDMKALVVPEGSDDGYVKIMDEPEIKKILFPQFKANAKTLMNPDDYNTMFVFKHSNDERTTYKGAFMHKTTNEIVLLTAQNTKPDSKHTDSQQSSWYVYNSEMIAPACFWKSFRCF